MGKSKTTADHTDPAKAPAPPEAGAKPETGAAAAPKQNRRVFRSRFAGYRITVGDPPRQEMRGAAIVTVDPRTTVVFVNHVAVVDDATAALLLARPECGDGNDFWEEDVAKVAAAQAAAAAAD